MLHASCAPETASQKERKEFPARSRVSLSRKILLSDAQWDGKSSSMAYIQLFRGQRKKTKNTPSKTRTRNPSVTQGTHYQLSHLRCAFECTLILLFTIPISIWTTSKTIEIECTPYFIVCLKTIKISLITRTSSLSGAPCGRRSVGTLCWYCAFFEIVFRSRCIWNVTRWACLFLKHTKQTSMQWVTVTCAIPVKTTFSARRWFNVLHNKCQVMFPW